MDVWLVLSIRTIWLFIDLHLFNMDLKWNHNCPSRIINFVYNTLARTQHILISRSLGALSSWIQHTRMYQKPYIYITVLLPSQRRREDEFSFLNGNQQLRSSSTLRFQSGRMRTWTCTSLKNAAQSMPWAAIFKTENQFFPSMWFYQIFARFINFCSCPFGVVTFNC